MYECVYWYAHRRICIVLNMRVPNHLLLSEHCKDLIKMCKSMTIITIVWMDKYLPIECIFSMNLPNHSKNTTLRRDPHTNTNTNTHLFQSVLLVFSLDCLFSPFDRKTQFHWMPLNHRVIFIFCDHFNKIEPQPILNSEKRLLTKLDFEIKIAWVLHVVRLYYNTLLAGWVQMVKCFMFDSIKLHTKHSLSSFFLIH